MKPKNQVVLVRDSDKGVWVKGIYKEYDNVHKIYRCKGDNRVYKYCIPYNFITRKIENTSVAYTLPFIPSKQCKYFTIGLDINAKITTKEAIWTNTNLDFIRWRLGLVFLNKSTLVNILKNDLIIK